MNRKHFISSAVSGFCLAAPLFSLSSCSQEELRPDGGVQEVTFCAQLPAGMTRSFGDGTKADELKAFVYDKDYNLVTQADGTIEGTNGTVTVQLACGVDYKVVFWAANAGKTTYTGTDGSGSGDIIIGGDEDVDIEFQSLGSTPYTINAATGEMTVNYEAMTANDDANDAFSRAIDYKGGDAAPATVSLTRPFAQVNFGSDDLNLPAVTSAYKGKIYTQVKFKAANSMNLARRTVATPSETYTTNGIALIPSNTEAFPVSGYEYTNMIYMLAPEGDTALTDMEFSVYTSTSEADKLHSFTVSAAPVQANFRTNVYGSLLTSNTDFNVEIAPIFAKNIDMMIEVKNTEQLMAALNTTSDVNIVLKGSIDPPTGGGPIVVGKEAVDNPGAGQPTAANPQVVTITAENGALLNTGFVAQGHTELHLYGAVNTRAARSKSTRSGGEYPMLQADNHASIYVHSGSYTTANATLAKATDGGKVEIENGSFATTAADASALIAREGTGEVVIRGGSFTGFNPTPYLAQGRYTVSNAGVYTVTDQRPPMSEPAGATVCTSWADLCSAVNAAESGSAFVVDGNIDVIRDAGTPLITIPAGKDITIYLRKSAAMNFTNFTTKNASFFPISVASGGKLNLGGEGKVTIDNIFLKSNGGTLVVDGGEYVSTSAHVIWAPSGNFTVESGRFVSLGVNTPNGALALNGNITINGGEFIAENANCATFVSGWSSKITVNNGVFKGGKAGLYTSSTPTININNGEFIGTIYGVKCEDNSDNLTANIKGGKFNGQYSFAGVKNSPFYNPVCTYNITGGIFTSKPVRFPERGSDENTELPLPAGYSWDAASQAPYQFKVVKN